MIKSKLIFLIIFFIFITSILLSSSLPTSFDWRNKDGQNWMTEVKCQREKETNKKRYDLI
jgi:hypothetical protein